MTNTALPPTPVAEVQPLTLPKRRSIPEVLGPFSEPVGVLVSLVIIIVGIIAFAYIAAVAVAGLKLLLEAVGVM